MEPAHDLKARLPRNGIDGLGNYTAPIAGRKTHSERGLQPDHTHRSVRINVRAVTELPEDVPAPAFDGGSSK